MAEFFQLSTEERLEALNAAANTINTTMLAIVFIINL